LRQPEQQACWAILLLLLLLGVRLLESRIWTLLLLQMRWQMQMLGLVAGEVPRKWCCQLLWQFCG
jgi:hypothetical protein